MAKYVCAIIGFTIAGLRGAIIGFIIGFILDFNLGFLRGDRRNFGEDSEHIFNKNFPFLLAALINSTGFAGNSVILIKQNLIKFFGANKAQILLANLKNIMNAGFSQTRYENAAYNLLINFDFNSRRKMVEILYEILKSKGNISNSELSFIRQTANYLNVTFGSDYYDFFDEFFRGNFSYNRWEYDYDERYNYNRYQKQTAKPEADPFLILNIDKNSTNDEIKKQYRSLCKKYHPDKTAGLSEKEKAQSEEKIKEIISAYEKIKLERNIK
ncbi:MAG TPA: J domain-containing protein [Spirochaetota bacterium]|nr:MAG: Chaperone protein DnaJ [Spirochaetes bacterium ADurb.Bin133]HNZ27185.1 J domain-containing protein [Spirochaetota bacterium]HPY88340.1 J domain-containing protein [Spirochaetota bacterium]HQB60239.1 J domain-containing protein [Spirochaetota bacterium]